MHEMTKIRCVCMCVCVCVCVYQLLGIVVRFIHAAAMPLLTAMVLRYTAVCFCRVGADVSSCE